MSNTKFPSGTFAQTDLTPVGDPAQGVYMDTENYLYQDSGDGKTLYDLGSQSYIDYNGNPVATPTNVVAKQPASKPSNTTMYVAIGLAAVVAFIVYRTVSKKK
jgi:hypothetical protein